ncbi:mitochondrial carrier domain-containing protein [Aspergillus avenaceus]|uniref:Mitochondrial carrier domain-containing protein n=1 Tax=Aspergillus avenaceus TaxID=36643 RepID=A0A5N6TKV7_ASPAV|nr:mitochondrial carrier domain-containing protein [Aspergillus avenaceus]
MRQHGIRHLYTGSMAFCVSNASKSGVRFVAFDSARKWMPVDSSGRVTPVGNMSAGLIAGITESVLVVTPGETLKTKVIDDRAGARVYQSAGHAVRTVLRTEGVSGLYQGTLPVTLKQSSNAMVRFTSYNFFLNQLRALPASHAQGGWITVISGALAGVVTVYATMPFDTIKTRLQAVGARTRYRNSVDCLRSVLTTEGVLALWKGTTPRLARLSISGAISFAIYERVVQATESLRGE